MRVAIKTLGCRLNQSEAQQFTREFTQAGCEMVAFGSESDISLLHTCVITATAEKQCLRLIRQVRRKNPDTHLVVAGCATALDLHDRLKAAGADQIILQAEKAECVALILQQFPKSKNYVPQPQNLFLSQARALLKVQDGCNFFCTYCIVPYTRGAPTSIPLEQCLTEAAQYISAGYREIVITGCNLACYHDKGLGLCELIEKIIALPGNFRVRTGSVEPNTVELQLAELIGKSDKMCHFMHLPLQSGDDQILQRMGRTYDTEQISRIIATIRDIVPDMGIGSDIITGFPGESQTSFEHTFAWLKTLPLNNLHVFPYSKRKGTPAATYSNPVSAEQQHWRTRQLLTLGDEMKKSAAQNVLHKPIEVLIERINSSGTGYGWSSEYLPCAIANLPQTTLRQLIRFKPQEIRGVTLYGTTADT